MENKREHTCIYMKTLHGKASTEADVHMSPPGEGSSEADRLTLTGNLWVGSLGLGRYLIYCSILVWEVYYGSSGS